MHMPLQAGDRVIATKEFRGVAKGTKGVVEERVNGLLGDYRVSFENGKTERCDEGEVVKLN